jgi:hypothetical protein
MRLRHSLLIPGAPSVPASCPLRQRLVFGITRGERDEGGRMSTRYDGTRCRHLWVTPLLLTLLVVPISACRSFRKMPSTVGGSGEVRRGVFDGVKGHAELLRLSPRPPRSTCSGLTSGLSRLAASVNPNLTVEAVNCTPSDCSAAYMMPYNQTCSPSSCAGGYT